jgi:symplekin
MRHILSVTSGCWEILLKALAEVGMEDQAERALKASRQQLDLMKGGRAARTRAAIFYEWDTSADASRAEKRQRDTDDAEARVRAAKIARGLGAGVQLPTSMSDSCELVLLNLKHMPSKRPPVASSAQRKQPVSLDVLVDAVLSNGASLSVDENHWYDRDGGFAWTLEEGEVDEDGRQELMYQCKATENETFMKQSSVAASRAFSRVLQSASSTRSEAATNLGKQLAARLAWMLKGVEPSDDLKDAQTMAVATENVQNNGDSARFARENPLTAACIGYDLVSSEGEKAFAAYSGLSSRVLNEIYVCNSNGEDDEGSSEKNQYSVCLDLYVASVVKACVSSTTSPSDSEKKRIANSAATSLPHQLLISPSVTTSSLSMVASLCDIEEVSKKAAKTPKQSIAESSALHAAKAAAEKRATSALLVLRDVAFQRDRMRGSAIGCAVAIAAGRVPASPPIQDKALKLVMNVLYQKNSDCAGKVVESATTELEHATQMSIDNHDKILKANAGKDGKEGSSGKAQLAPQSEEEKVILDKVRLTTHAHNLIF